MRILFCSFHYPPGGGSRFSAALAEKLAGRHDVTVVAPSARGLPRLSLIAGVRVIRAPVFFGGVDPAQSLPAQLVYIPMGVAAGKRLLETEAFDIIHSHTLLPAGRVGDTLSRFSGTPNVLSIDDGELVSSHGPVEPRSGLLQTWARRLARRADCVVCPSPDVASRLHEALGAAVSPEVVLRPADGSDDCAQRYELLFERMVRQRLASAG